jgi:hypothetical protein
MNKPNLGGHVVHVRDGPTKALGRILPLVEFTYNNSYQSTIKMVPFEFLYGRPCQMPLSWDRLEDRVLVGPEVIQEMEDQMKTIRQRIKEARIDRRVMSMRIVSTVVTKLAIESSCG